ncbi:MAG: hypothetical protein IT423_03540 [Pirellulaceae bacterium]|nr:hypothetical protein [Pirellulaceae bacterium]
MKPGKKNKKSSPNTTSHKDTQAPATTQSPVDGTAAVHAEPKVAAPITPDELHDSIDMESSTVGEATKHLLRLFHYSASLPERTLRSAGALAGGLMRESANWLLPSAFRNSRSYSIFIQQMLDFVCNDIGGVRKRWGASPADPASDLTAEEQAAENQAFLARKTVGNLLDMSALATFHLSPLTVLAIFSDVAYGSQHYLHQLSERLKSQNIIDANTTIDSATDLLGALERASASAAGVFDKPPISLEGLRKTITETQNAILDVDPMKLLPAAEIDQLWRQIDMAAKEQNASIWDVSATISLVALGNIQAVGQGTLVGLEVAGNLFNEHIVQHYWEGLRAIERQGLIPTLSRASTPYLEAVWTNFAVDRKTWTEQLLSGDLIKWGWSQISWPKLMRGTAGS